MHSCAGHHERCLEIFSILVFSLKNDEVFLETQILMSSVVCYLLCHEPEALRIARTRSGKVSSEIT